MNRRPGLIVLITLGVILAMAPAALAGKPVKPPKPTPPELWTCEARVANGATGWMLPDADDPYVVTGLAACIDILAADRSTPEWTVAWEGATQRGSVKGLRLVFEEEVHGTVYAEEVLRTESGVWCPNLDSAPRQNVVFVAMPHNGDKWESFRVTLIEGHAAACTE